MYQYIPYYNIFQDKYKVKKKIMEYQEAFNTIREFYDHAWQQLIFIIGILIGVVGVLPIAWNIVQHHSGKRRMADFEKQLKQYEETLKKLEVETNMAKGGVYLMQGNSQILNEGYWTPRDALLSYLTALICFLDADIEKYINISLECIMSTTNNFSFPKDLPNSDNEIKEAVKNSIHKLEIKNKKDRYKDDISYLKSIFTLYKGEVL
jgi:hypothetical protein